MNRESIEKYQEIFRKDPNSQVFAALADAYRDYGLYEQAEKVARHGVQRHPSYVSGFVALGRVLVAKENWKEAEQVLQKATSLAPENILAHQLLAQVYLQQKRPKDALRAYKLVLFLNPNSASAKSAVEKLESLTADEYEEEVFEMKKLSANDKVTGEKPFGQSLERTLSLIDAFIVRNEIPRAKNLIREVQKNYPTEQRLKSRWELVGEDEVFEEALSLQPDMNRETYIRNRKLKRLEFLLHRINELN